MTKFKPSLHALSLYGLTLFLLLTYAGSSSAGSQADEFAALRDKMVSQQIEARGISDPDVLKAMKVVPRHLFVPPKYRNMAYRDHPLPIGAGQTISQPYIVALMTDLLRVKPNSRILEIGTGSGYQAAVLAELKCDVYSVEIIPVLGKNARETLTGLGYRNIHIRIGDGHKGWPEKAPFDAIIVTCAPERIPQPLIRQLKEGGRLIIPVGRAGGIQQLVSAVKEGDQLVSHSVLPVRFVPMVKEVP